MQHNSRIGVLIAMITVAGCNLSDSLTRMAMDNPAEGGQGTAVEKGLAGLQKSSTDNSSEDILKTLIEKYDHLIDAQPDSTIRKMVQELQGHSFDPENSRQVVKQQKRQEIERLKLNVERARELLEALQKYISESHPYAHQLYTKKVQIFQAITNFHDKKVSRKAKTKTINRLQGECEKLIDDYDIERLQALGSSEARIFHTYFEGIFNPEIDPVIMMDQSIVKRVWKKVLKNCIAAAEESREIAQQQKAKAEAEINYGQLVEIYIQIIQAIIDQPTLF